MQAASSAPWNMLDPFFRQVALAYQEDTDEEPGMIADLDRWVTRFRSRLESFGLNVRDEATVYTVAVAIVVASHAQVEAVSGCCGQPETLAHIEETLDAIGYALAEMRKDVRA